jgi:hypothetical protein
MDPIKELEVRLNELVKSREAFSKHVDRNALKEYVSTLVSEARGITQALSEVANKTMGAAIKDLISKASTSEAVKTYTMYLTALKNEPSKNASRMEEEIPFSSLAEANKRRLAVLTELELQIDELFTHNTINMFNGRLSHIVVVGIIAQSKMMFKYSKYMLSAVVSAITNQHEVAKYRYAWMKDYNQATAEVVAKSIGSNNSYDFASIIADMQNKAIDVTLIDDFNKVTVDMVNSSQISGDAKAIISFGVKKLGLFRWIGEVWETEKHDWKETKRRELEWMRAHVEILKLKLQNTPEDSPEYQRLVRIIERYEEMIAKADKQSEKDKE